MTYRILCQRPDYKLSIICDDISITKEEILKRNVSFIPADTIEYKVVEKSALNPEELDYWHDSESNAYLLSGGVHGVDMERGRILHMKKIRKLRDEKLKKLDIEQLKGEDVQVQKQILRDIPQNFDLTIVATPEQLKALWPEQLND